MALTQVKTSGIADDAVTTDKLANAINTERTANTAKVSLTDNSVTLAKMAGGTDGQIITYDANGDPVAVGPGTDGQVLTSTGAGSPPAFEDAVSEGTQVKSTGESGGTKFLREDGDGTSSWQAVPAGGATINSATENELVTVASTTTQLDAEANLTFDGNNLSIGGTAATDFHGNGRDLVVGSYTGSNGMTIVSNDNDEQGNIFFADGNGTDGKDRRGKIQYNHRNNNYDYMEISVESQPVARFGDGVTQYGASGSNGYFGVGSPGGFSDALYVGNADGYEATFQINGQSHTMFEMNQWNGFSSRDPDQGVRMYMSTHSGYDGFWFGSRGHADNIWFRIGNGSSFGGGGNKMTLSSSGLTVHGSLSKSSGSFDIAHPMESKKDTHRLRHSFVEGPQCDNIYRGKLALSSGTATVNIDTKFGMSQGTFVALNRDIQCFTSNESGWGAVKGSVSGNVLTITAQDNSSTDTISWMVVGERQDAEIKASSLTDDDGNLIVERVKTASDTPPDPPEHA